MAFAAAVEAFNVIASRNRRRTVNSQEIEMPVLLITGAGRGIGAATASLAAARGYDVGVNYKSDAKSAADVVAAVKAKGGTRWRSRPTWGARPTSSACSRRPMRSGG